MRNWHAEFVTNAGSCSRAPLLEQPSQCAVFTAEGYVPYQQQQLTNVLIALLFPFLQEACWAAFINRVRDNLHCVLAMSPVGGAFRARCRMFPSLINCCTIDWFRPWPEQALLSVSSQILEPLDLTQPQVKPALATMCVHIHTSVALASDRMYAQLRRRCEPLSLNRLQASQTTPFSSLAVNAAWCKNVGLNMSNVHAAQMTALHLFVRSAACQADICSCVMPCSVHDKTIKKSFSHTLSHWPIPRSACIVCLQDVTEKLHAMTDAYRYYTSPKSYMDLISLYTSLLAEKRAEYGEAEDRLNNGLNKLRETNAVVDTMQTQLNQLQPILEEKAQVRNCSLHWNAVKLICHKLKDLRNHWLLTEVTSKL